MSYPKFRICLAAVALGILMAACSSSPTRQPAALGQEPAGLSVRLSWSSKVGAINYPAQLHVSGGRVGVASSDGVVVLLDATTGADIWRTSIGASVSAGVGHDGQTLALATTGNEILALRNGAVLWRFKMPARVYTAPLVAGGRVFVLAADRSVTALDADNGSQLWRQARSQSDALVLEQAGVLVPVGNTLVAGFPGRLAGMNPGTGSTLWDALFASSRATNDVERLLDVVGPVNRLGSSVCARAYQNAVGCVNAATGQSVWSKPSAGYSGLGGNEQAVFGADAESVVTAYSRDKGEKLWSSDRFQYRDQTAPRATSKGLVVGDAFGYLHWLALSSGQATARLQVDSSAVIYSPLVLADGRVLAITRSGTLAALTAN
jgi:outer membrane assembly lipoprotein YfgL